MVPQFDSEMAVTYVEELRSQAREARRVREVTLPPRRRVAAALVACVAMLDPDFLRHVSESRL